MRANAPAPRPDCRPTPSAPRLLPGRGLPRFRLQYPDTPDSPASGYRSDFTPRRFGNTRGNAQERPAVPARRRGEIACADAGRKQRLQRTRPATIGSARQARPRNRRRLKQPRWLPRSSIHRRRRKCPNRPSRSRAGWRARSPRRAAKSRRDRALFDLLPVGVLIYRLDRLLYANRVFLDRMGYASLQALEEAGGLDALYVEPGVSSRQQHLGKRHAGDDIREPGRVRTCAVSADRCAPVHDLMGRRNPRWR